MINYVKTLFVDFFSTVYPTNCAICAEILVTNERHLCTSCLLGLPKTNYHLQLANPLFQALDHNPLLVNAFCFLHYNHGGTAQTLLHRIKYQNRPDLGTFLGELYGKDLLADHLDVDLDVIIPVPMHRQKRKQRGYNQAENIAEGISNVLDIPTSFNAVIKSVNTDSQTDRSKMDRWQNVQNAFRVLSPLQLYRKKVLIVDDVITTGATVSELCDELINCDVEEITVCSIASGIK